MISDADSDLDLSICSTPQWKPSISHNERPWETSELFGKKGGTNKEITAISGHAKYSVVPLSKNLSKTNAVAFADSKSVSIPGRTSDDGRGFKQPEVSGHSYRELVTNQQGIRSDYTHSPSEAYKPTTVLSELTPAQQIKNSESNRELRMQKGEITNNKFRTPDNSSNGRRKRKFPGPAGALPKLVIIAVRSLAVCPVKEQGILRTKFKQKTYFFAATWCRPKRNTNHKKHKSITSFKFTGTCIVSHE